FCAALRISQALPATSPSRGARRVEPQDAVARALARFAAGSLSRRATGLGASRPADRHGLILQSDGAFDERIARLCRSCLAGRELLVAGGAAHRENHGSPRPTWP